MTRRKRSKSPRVDYLRVTMEYESIVAIREYAEREKISYGLALEKMLNESKIYQEMLKWAKGED